MSAALSGFLNPQYLWYEPAPVKHATGGTIRSRGLNYVYSFSYIIVFYPKTLRESICLNHFGLNIPRTVYSRLFVQMIFAAKQNGLGV